MIHKVAKYPEDRPSVDTPNSFGESPISVTREAARASALRKSKATRFVFRTIPHNYEIVFSYSDL